MLSIDKNNRKKLFDRNDELSKSNLFIEAGAGAGKSTTMVQKIIDQIKNDHILPEKMVIITFTNKSAEDILRKITEDIGEAEKKGEISGVFNDLYKMNVSTIHSFCNKLLSENSFDARFSYMPKVLEEDETEGRKAYIFRVWKNFLDTDSRDEISVNIDDKNPYRKIEKTYNLLCDCFDDVEVVADFEPYEDIKDQVFLVLGQIYNLLGEYGLENLGSYALKFKDAFEKFIAQFGENNVDFSKNEIAFEGLKELLKTLRKDFGLNSKKVDKSTCENFKSDYQELFDDSNIGELKKTLTNCVTILSEGPQIINKYAYKAWEFYKKALDKESVSNNQLILETYNMLKNETIREKIAKNYDVIYVDEFQDTDVYQIKFVIDLARMIDDRKLKEGKQSTSLFLVGDPKQSIYRFRGADINSFNSVKNAFESYGPNFKTIFFPDNFRSSRNVLNYVNDVFSDVFKASDMEYNSMTSNIPDVASKDEFSLNGVYSIDLGNRENHIHNTVKLIKSLVGKYSILKEVSRGVFAYDLIKVSDFLLLTTSTSEIEDYLRVFSESGLKLNVAGKIHLGNLSHVFRIIYRVLAAILDPENNNLVSLRHVLKEFYGEDFDIEEVKKLKLSPYGYLVYLLNNFRLKIKKYTPEEGYAFKAVATQIIEHMAIDISANATTLLDALDIYIREEIKEEIVLDEKADAAKIMNIHKSKGLEGNIVLMCSSGGFMNSSDGKDGNKIYLNNLDFYYDVKAKIKKEMDKEKRRLEYVAATRAKSLLIFETLDKPSGLFFTKEQNYNFDNEFLKQYQLEDSALPEINLEEEKEEIDSTFEITFSNYEELPTSQIKNPIKNVSPSDFEESKVVAPKEQIRIYHRPASNVFGDALHKLMESYVLTRLNDVDLLIKELVKNDEENDLSKFVPYLKDCFYAIKDVYDEYKILDAKALRPEYEFMSYENGTLMHGFIDLLAIYDDKAVIYDYKSDVAGFINKDQFEDNLKRAYGPQLEAYEKEMKKIYKDLPIEKYIIWVEENNSKQIGHLLKI